MSDNFETTGALLSMLLVGSLAWLLGYSMAHHNRQMDAVKAGHAEFVISNQATGETSFRWKEIKE